MTVYRIQREAKHVEMYPFLPANHGTAGSLEVSRKAYVTEVPTGIGSEMRAKRA